MAIINEAASDSRKLFSMTQSFNLMPGAEPYFHKGDNVGCLCLHGFTASPAEVKWFAQHLAEAGHTVYVPRLAGHGTRPEDLARTTWTDWYGSAADGYHLLMQQCEKVFVCGISMGSLLALLLSADLPVAGVIAMATPLVMNSGPQNIAFIRLLKYLLPYTNQADTSDLPERVRAEQARRGEMSIGRVRYDQWSTAAYEQLLRLRDETLSRLPEISAPLLLIFSEQDKLIGLEGQQIICGSVQSQHIQTHILKESGHILTPDIEMLTVFKLAADFIARA
jgi:carboxylesterase